MKRAVTPILAGVLLLACGCQRAKPEASRTGSEKSRSMFSRFLSPETPAGYAWDGQFSRAAVPLPIDAAYNRGLEVLRGMSFAVNESESRRQGATARIVAAHANGTAAQLTFESKAAGETLVRAKVGATGDRGGSERLLDELQKTPRTAPPKRKAP